MPLMLVIAPTLRDYQTILQKIPVSKPTSAAEQREVKKEVSESVFPPSLPLSLLSHAFLKFQLTSTINAITLLLYTATNFLATMKLSAAIITLLAGSAAAFAPVMPSAAVRASSIQQQTVMFAEPKEEEEGGLDLDLDEMFSMFDAADKGEDFDKAIKDVKKDN
eukprot:scaffold6542_cov105-Skeletonema_marinoi.AAC.2